MIPTPLGGFSIVNPIKGILIGIFPKFIILYFHVDEKRKVFLFPFKLIKGEKDGKSVYYFAYGSCMDEESFRSTVGEKNYEVMGKAVLSGYRLAFTMWSSKWQGGVADLLPSPADKVEGVLYKLLPAAWEPLDRREGVPLGHYRRVVVEVVWKGKRVRAVTYTVVDKAAEEMAPSPSYRRAILNGVERFLDPSYREKLLRLWRERFGLPPHTLD
jgi:cation transport regulator ChaC